ncbi:tyrosine-type recombinase/integrase [Rubrolithibacter danxiaensis]|uniref:tyrosine-type recombinase/integrase n=1 Tax=Rubrolithibacter danxiaensis TaxID=3390805 RepID=UPI003BF9181A
MFIERFIQYLQFEKRYSPHTVGAYKNDLLQFFAYIQSQEWDFSSLEHAHLRSYLAELIEDKREPKTINRKISVLRSYYKFLLREKAVSSNPTLQIRAPKVPKRLPVIVEENKLNLLLDSGDSFSADFPGLRDKLVIELLFGTGIRLAELITLKDTDVDSYNRTIKVLGKRSKERIIPLNSSLYQLIKEYLEEKDKQNFEEKVPQLVVINNGKAAYPKFIYRVVQKYLSTISTQDKKSPHVLRHTFATTLLNNGADLNAIKELLGHSSLAATQVYTHNSVERLKSIYKQAHPKA